MYLYVKPTTKQKVFAQRTRWLGHIIRQPDQRTVKKVLYGVERGKEKGGRPRKKWLEEV